MDGAKIFCCHSCSLILKLHFFRNACRFFNFIPQRLLDMRPLLIAMLIILTTEGKAQTSFGIKSGINISNQLSPYVYMYNDNPWYDRGQSIVCMNGAFFTQFVMFNKVSLRLQVGYNGLGYKVPEAYDALGILISPARKFRLNYFSLPLQVIYEVKPRFGKIWIGAGPYAAYLFSGTIHTGSAKQRIVVGNSGTNEFKPLDLGLSPTVSLKLNNGFLVGVDYNIGLSDVSEAAGNNQNRSWSFYIGYVFK
jgi:hypothetical protein